MKDNTAMVRTRMSIPLRLAIEARIATKATTLLDYGCGRGDDVRLLCQRGFHAIGYDPAWGDMLRKLWVPRVSSSTYVTKPTKCDVVFLTYVLCVIENPRERERVLKKAFSLARKALVVTVRTDFDSFKNCKSEKDGFRTASGSFQRPFRAKEFRDFVTKVLKRPVRQLKAGVLVVSKEKK